MSKYPDAVSRFAPSPTGYLHLGHLVNAIYVWGIVRTLGGKVILRMEDHDRGRCRPEYEAAILEDLDWLGLVPDIGLPGEFQSGETPYRQSDNHTAYEAQLHVLVERGLVYTCTCSRKQILSRTGGGGEELRYDGHCRERGYRPDVDGGARIRLAAKKYQINDAALGMLEQAPAAQCGDLLLRDRHGNWTYQFAVTVDDWQQGVNLVIRGEDLVDSTARQIQLAELLDRKTPPLFLHHPLLADDEGRKLSKRDLAKGLRDYRAEGWTAERVLGEAAWRVGLLDTSEPLSAAGMPALFEGGMMAARVRDRLFRS